MVNRYLLIFLVIFLGSCSSLKQKIVKKKQLVEYKIEQKDSVSIVRVSEPIRDTIVVSLKTDNKVVDSIVNSRLKYLTATRSSGSNKFKIKYDTIYKTIVVETQVQGSTNKEVHTDSKKSTDSKKVVIDKKETVKTNNTKLYIFIGVIILLLGAFIGIKLYKKFWL